MTAGGLKTAADQLQKFLVEQLGLSFGVGLLTKRGRSLVAGKDQASSVWPCSWAFCPRKGVTFQEGAGAWETKPAAKNPGSPVQLCSSSRESREGWTSRIWWEEGWLDKGFRTSSQKSGNLSFSFLEIVMRGGKQGKKGFYYICQTPQGSLSGVQPQGSTVCQHLFCSMRHKKPTFKMGVSRGTENEFFFSLSFTIS